MISKVTFLVPVYNGGEFLAECLSGILGQTYSHWNAIIVNNNSADGTAEIIAAYCERDSRFSSVTNLETVSVIENHNIAARHIPLDSTYCKVLHVDDWMSADCLEEMVKLADANPQVGVIGAWAHYGEELACQVLPFDQQVFDGAEICTRALLGEIQPFLSPSVLMIRCTCLHAQDNFYELAGLHADIDATYTLLRECDFASVAQPLFRIGRHENSMTSTESAPLNKNIVNNLDLFLRHGPHFLSSKQCDERLEEMLEYYYLFLARSSVKPTPIGFWSFHRSELKALGLPLQGIRLARSMLSFYCSHPRAVARVIKRGITRRRAS